MEGKSIEHIEVVDSNEPESMRVNKDLPVAKTKVNRHNTTSLDRRNQQKRTHIYN